MALCGSQARRDSGEAVLRCHLMGSVADPKRACTPAHGNTLSCANSLNHILTGTAGPPQEMTPDCLSLPDLDFRAKVQLFLKQTLRAILVFHGKDAT